MGATPQLKFGALTPPKVVTQGRGHSPNFS